MSEGPDIHGLILHDPVRPFPLTLLARQLEFIFLGIPTTTIFCYDGDLVERIDPSDPPAGIVPNSRQAFLLERFLSVRTRHRCTVKGIDPATGSGKRCNNGSYGYMEILKHQREVHHKTRHYTCILEECMAVFDRIGNAKRHSEKIHSTDTVDGRLVLPAERRHEMQVCIKASQKRAEQRRERRAAAEGQLMIQRARVRRTLKFPEQTDKQEMNQAVFLRMRVRPSVLDVRSTIKKDRFCNKLRIDVIPTMFTRIDVGRFHKDYIKCGRFEGGYVNTIKSEWVAVTGFMDICHGKGNLLYRFVESCDSNAIKSDRSSTSYPEDSE